MPNKQPIDRRRIDEPLMRGSDGASFLNATRVSPLGDGIFIRKASACPRAIAKARPVAGWGTVGRGMSPDKSGLGDGRRTVAAHVFIKIRRPESAA